MIGLEVERSEPLYVEGHRPWQMGWVMSSGGETVGIWLEVALDAFYLELNGGAEGDCVWMTCSCGAVLVRVVAFG